jgi:hypothetical protein
MSEFKCDQYTKMTTPISSVRKSPEQLQDEADAAFESKQESEKVAYAERKAAKQREAADHVAAALEMARVQKKRQLQNKVLTAYHAKRNAVILRREEEDAASEAELSTIHGSTGFIRTFVTTRDM